MEACEQLRVDYLAEEVCLFIGAGVSMGCGLPDWRGLAEGVVRLFPRKLVPPGLWASTIGQGKTPLRPNALSDLKADVLKLEDPLLSMRYAKSIGGFDLNTLVCKCLYAESIKLSETVLEIPSLKNVRRICCFNYDDILDRSFAERSTVYIPLFQDDRIPLESPQTIIFYPHGFLPDPKRHSFPATNKIVLSEDDYHDLYHSPYAWANMIQLTLLLNYTALFIGCSLLDPNVRRLLGISAKMRPTHNHYAFVRDPYNRKDATWFEMEYATAFRSVQEQILRGLGVRPVWFNEYSEIASALKTLRA